MKTNVASLLRRTFSDAEKLGITRWLAGTETLSSWLCEQRSKGNKTLRNCVKQPRNRVLDQPHSSRVLQRYEVAQEIVNVLHRTGTVFKQTVSDTQVAALSAAVLGTAVFFASVGLVTRVLHWMFDARYGFTERGLTTISITGSALGEWIFFGLMVLFLKRRGRSLIDLGLDRPSPLRGWIAAAVFTALYVWVVFETALKGQVTLTEPSAFHLYGSLAAGLSAGIVEETFFRGFIMNQLRWAGFGRTVQLIASSLLFGVAHVGWGLFSKHPNLALATGAMLTTSVLGLFFALAYVASRRSLTPVLLGHLTMDLLIEPWLVLATLTSTMAHPHV